MSHVSTCHRTDLATPSKAWFHDYNEQGRIIGLSKLNNLCHVQWNFHKSYMQIKCPRTTTTTIINTRSSLLCEIKSKCSWSGLWHSAFFSMGGSFCILFGLGWFYWHFILGRIVTHLSECAHFTLYALLCSFYYLYCLYYSNILQVLNYKTFIP